MSNLPKRFVAVRIAGLPRPELHDRQSSVPSVSPKPKIPNVADSGRIRFGAGFRLSLRK